MGLPVPLFLDLTEALIDGLNGWPYFMHSGGVKAQRQGQFGQS